MSVVLIAMEVIEQIKNFPFLRHKEHLSVHSTLFVALLINGQIDIIHFSFLCTRRGNACIEKDNTKLKIFKGGVIVANIKNLELTQDPLTNIRLMVPMLNDRAREAVSYFMYGCCVGESIAADAMQEKQEDE